MPPEKKKKYDAEDPINMHDIISMNDFYGRKRLCLKLGHPMTKEDS